MTTPSQVVQSCEENSSTVHPHRYLECDLLQQHAEPMGTVEGISNVITTSKVKDEPFCGILVRVKTLDINGGQINQETIAVTQSKQLRAGAETRDWKTGVGVWWWMLRNWQKVAKQWDAVHCTWVFIIRSWSVKMPRSWTVTDGETNVERIKEP